MSEHFELTIFSKGKEMAAQPGLEPGTKWLTVTYSTIELLGSRTPVKWAAYTHIWSLKGSKYKDILISYTDKVNTECIVTYNLDHASRPTINFGSNPYGSAWSIHVDSAILYGQPVVEGISLSNEFLLSLFAYDWIETQILENYSKLTYKFLLAIFAFVVGFLREGILYADAKFIIRFLTNENILCQST